MSGADVIWNGMLGIVRNRVVAYKNKERIVCVGTLRDLVEDDTHGTIHVGERAHVCDFRILRRGAVFLGERERHMARGAHPVEEQRLVGRTICVKFAEAVRDGDVVLVLGLVFRIVEPPRKPGVQIVETRFGRSKYHAVVARLAQNVGQGAHARIRVVRKEGHLRVRPDAGKNPEETFDGRVAYAVRVREIEPALCELADVRELLACRGDADIAAPAAESLDGEQDDIGLAASCLELHKIVLAVFFAFACRCRTFHEGIICKGEPAEQRDAFGVIAALFAFRELVLDFGYEAEGDRRDALPAHVARREPVLRRESRNRKRKCNPEADPVPECHLLAPLREHLAVQKHRPDNPCKRNERREQKVPCTAQEHAPHQAHVRCG